MDFVTVASIIAGIITVSMIIGFFIGFRKGQIRGMEQFISIIKVYDNDILLDVQSMLHKVSGMSEQEKINAFTDYLEKHKGQV